MKRKVLLVLVLLSAISAFALENSVEEVMQGLDEVVDGYGYEEALVTIGFITYQDSNTCGTIVPYIQERIKKASENLQHIKIVKTTDLSEYEQSGIATRGLGRGIGDDNSTSKQKKLILVGTYTPDSGHILFQLTLHDVENEFWEYAASWVTLEEVTGYTLYPTNIKLAETVQEDFNEITNQTDTTDSNQNNNQNNSQKQNTKSAGRINLSASMLDSNGELVNILHPNDVVRFKITADFDCYIAILCIDANGVKTWLPTTSNFMEANVSRLFPDISGAVLRVANDGVFGAEQVVIYASTGKEGLPSQGDNGKYTSQDLHMIMKNQQNARKDKNNKTGTFKITYTIIK